MPRHGRTHAARRAAGRRRGVLSAADVGLAVAAGWHDGGGHRGVPVREGRPEPEVRPRLRQRARRGLRHHLRRRADHPAPDLRRRVPHERLDREVQDHRQGLRHARARDRLPPRPLPTPPGRGRDARPRLPRHDRPRAHVRHALAAPAAARARRAVRPRGDPDARVAAREDEGGRTRVPRHDAQLPRPLHGLRGAVRRAAQLRGDRHERGAPDEGCLRKFKVISTSF